MMRTVGLRRRRRLRRLARTVLPALAILLASSAGAGAAVLPGWPAPAPPGSVHLGPDGGIAVIVPSGTVAAFRADGRLLWRYGRAPSCGNCDDGRQVPGRQPDGSYGPIGFEGDDFWALDAAGREVPGCAGVVYPDGGCAAADVLGPPLGARLTRRRGEAVQWIYEEPDHRWVPEFEVPPPVFRDGGGVLYVGVGAGLQPSDGQAAPARLLAVDEATGALRWRRLDAEPVAALGRGVLARSGSSLIALDSEGRELWRHEQGEFAAVLVDADRGRIYLQPREEGSGDLRSVIALDLATGRQVWRTAVGERVAPLSITVDGLLLAGVVTPRRTALRAIGPEGRGRWSHPTATAVVGARGLADGTVALVTEGAPSYLQRSLLLRIDPRVKERAVRRPSFRLDRRRIATECPAGACDSDRRVGAVLRIRLPRGGEVGVRLAGSRSRVSFGAPAGTSHVRIGVEDGSARRGRSAVVVTFTDRGRRRAIALPVTVR